MEKKVITEFAYQNMVSDRNYMDEVSRLLQWSAQEKALAARLLKSPIPMEEIRKEGWEGLSPAFGHTEQEVYLYPVVAGYIAGELPDPEYGTLPDGMKLIFPAMEQLYGARGLVDEITELFTDTQIQEDEKAFACVLVENGRSGAHFIAGQAACRMGMPLLIWDGRKPCFQELLLTAVLYDALICVDAADSDNEAFQRHIKQLAERTERFVILADSREACRGLEEYVRCLYRRLPSANRSDREQCLADYVQDGDISIPGKIYKRLADSSYSIDSMKRVLDEFTTQAQLAGHGTLTQEAAEQILEYYDEQDKKENGLFGIRQLASNRRLSDLCLPKEHHDKLTAVCAMLKKRDKVMREWGFADKYSYGNGSSMLFYGAPGTGKTMAAQAVAGELGMPLYRVDLSQLISKYIGETQKNIGKIFEQAGQLKGILLFDEADALFAKRNEVNDAQDKYSNAETAYLLQRIEEWDGICILATNLLQNFDEAFRRRITYMINFPMPDESVREQLWQKVFPPQALTAEDIDAGILAQSFELSGAAIRNAALQGAYLAAVEESEIGMRHILSGIANEFRKLNKSMKPEQKALLEKYDAS